MSENIRKLPCNWVRPKEKRRQSLCTGEGAVTVESYLHVRRLLTITEIRLDRDRNVGAYKGGEQ